MKLEIDKQTVINIRNHFLHLHWIDAFELFDAQLRREEINAEKRRIYKKDYDQRPYVKQRNRIRSKENYAKKKQKNIKT